MPAVQAPALVLVTGASGFIAAHTVRELLEQGFRVRGTVRSNEKGDYLKAQFENYGDKFSYVIVEDIEQPDAFDEAVKGVDAVEHMASPFHFKADDPSEVIGPAISGTTGVLKSVAKNAPTVKRVVVTSSAAAIAETRPAGHVFTEADWNNESIALVEKEGKKAPGSQKYRASKSLAEKAAWKFVEDNAGKINFDLAVINPPFVFGPTIHQVASPEKLNESNEQFYRNVKSPSRDTALNYIGNAIDVRTTAQAHVRALEREEAGGNRFIVSVGPFCWNDIFELLTEQRIANVPEPFPDQRDNTKFYKQSGQKAQEVLGIEYIDFSKTVADTLQSIRDRFPGSV